MKGVWSEYENEFGPERMKVSNQIRNGNITRSLSDRDLDPYRLVIIRKRK
jgi:hypothetical protein